MQYPNESTEKQNLTQNKQKAVIKVYSTNDKKPYKTLRKLYADQAVQTAVNLTQICPPLHEFQPAGLSSPHRTAEERKTNPMQYGRRRLWERQAAKWNLHWQGLMTAAREVHGVPRERTFWAAA